MEIIMNDVLIMVLILLTAGLILSNGSLFLHRRRKHIRNVKENNISPDKYCELSDRIQWIQITIIMVGILITILGWNIKSNITAEIKRETVGELLNRIKGISTVLDSLSNEKTLLLKSYKNIKDQNVEIIDKVSRLNKTYQPVFHNIENAINKSNTILQAYIVKNIREIPRKEKISRLYFKNMQPVNVDRLPTFKTAPIVGIFNNCAWEFEVKNVTSKYIDVYFWSRASEEQDFMFWILEPIIKIANN